MLEFQSKRKRWVVGAIVLVVVVGGAFGYGPLRRAWARRQAEIALASAHRCLFGAPLERGEQPSGRIRRIFLAGAPEGWPARCDRYVRDHLKARKDSETGSNPEADAYAQMGAEAQLADVARGSMGVTQFFDVFYAERPARPAPDDVPAAPAALQIPDERTPALIVDGSLIGASADPIPAGDVRLFASGTVCRLTDELDKARCQKLSSSQGEARLLQGAADGGPTLLAVQASSYRGLVLLTDSGKLVCDHALLGGECRAFARADGDITLVRPTENAQRRAYELVRIGKREAGPITAAALDERALVVSDRAYWMESSDSGAKLMRLDLGSGEPSEVASLPHGGALRACALEKSLVVHLVDREKHHLVFVPEKGDIAQASFEHQEIESFDSQPVVLSCGVKDAYVTEVRTYHRSNGNGYLIRWAHCAPSGCKHGVLRLDDVLRDVGSPQRPGGIFSHEVRAVGLDGKLLVLWRSEQAGLRFRIAAPDSLAKADERVAFDDKMNGGAAFEGSLVHESFVLLARHRAAVLLMDTMLKDEGVRAVRIAPDGAVATVSLD